MVESSEALMIGSVVNGPYRVSASEMSVPMSQKLLSTIRLYFDAVKRRTGFEITDLHNFACA